MQATVDEQVIGARLAPEGLAETEELHSDDMADQPAIPEDLADLDAHIPPARIPVVRFLARGHQYAPRPPHQSEDDWCAMSSNDRNKMLRAYDRWRERAIREARKARPASDAPAPDAAAAVPQPPERPLHVSEDLWSTLSPAQQQFEVKAQPHGFHPANVTPCLPAPEGSAFRAPRGAGTRAERNSERARKAVTGTARYVLAMLVLLVAWRWPTIVVGDGQSLW